MEIHTINLEDGRPTVETARQRLCFALRRAKSQRLAALKFIHGYGSSGSGGKIRTMTRKELAIQKQSGSIRAFVPGELFSPFEPVCQEALGLCFALSRDKDYQRANPGITVVVL